MVIHVRVAMFVVPKLIRGGKFLLPFAKTGVRTGFQALKTTTKVVFAKPKTAGTIALTGLTALPFIAGVVKTKPEIVTRAPEKAFKFGQKVATPKDERKEPLTIKEGLLGAGLLGAGIVAVPKAIDIIKNIPTPKLPGRKDKPLVTPNVPVIPSPTSTNQLSPAVVEEVQDPEKVKAQPPIIKITNKPEINIAIAH